MRGFAVVLILVSVASSSVPLSAQAAPPGEDDAAALTRCTALADVGRTAEAAEAGRAAESGFRRRLGRDGRDVEALVGLARALAQCVVPSVNLLRRGEMSAEAMDLLEQALELRPDHWAARFTLASIAYRSPSFLGRGKRAAQELDELLRRQGDSTENPRFARTFAMRGEQLLKAKQVDSARAILVRGARLFPADTQLARLLTELPPVAASVPLAAMRVVAGPRAPTSPASAVEVGRGDVLYAAGGTADVFRVVQMQPGATSVGDGADIYTRGGDPAETALILNGARLLSLHRFEGLNGGLFGAIDPFVLKAARYSAGGFTARHGNALSGVLEIDTEGRPREHSTRIGLSLVQLGATARLPASRTSGGWISARLANTSALLGTHGRRAEFDGAPHSQELIASWVITPHRSTEVQATALVEQDASRRVIDAAGWSGPFHAEGATRAVIAQARWLAPRKPLILRINTSASFRGHDWRYGVLSRTRAERTALARGDIEWMAGSSLQVRAGTELARWTRADAGRVPTSGSVAAGSPSRPVAEDVAGTTHRGGYGELVFTASHVRATAGLRVDRLPGEGATTVDPRVAASYAWGRWTARVSGGVFHQGRWRGTSAIPDAGTPGGLPLTARHLVVGLEREGTKGLFRLEVFDKRYADFAAFGDGPAVAATQARGAEILAQRTLGMLTGWISYSMLDGRARLVDGTRTRSPFDVTHSLTSTATLTMGDWSTGATLRYGSGAPRTRVVGTTLASDGSRSPVFGPWMSDRAPAFARTDLRLMRHHRSPSVLISSFVEVLNVFDRANMQGSRWNPATGRSTATPTFFASRTFVAGVELTFR